MTEEIKLLTKLEEIINSNLDLIDDKVGKAYLDFTYSNKDSYTTTIPIESLGNDLPKEAGLFRIYIQKADTIAKVERHKNSTQRVMSYRGTGSIRVQDNDAWTSNPLKSHGNIKGKWLTVKPNIWHQPIASDNDWITLTFHTASESEIIDEYQ